MYHTIVRVQKLLRVQSDSTRTIGWYLYNKMVHAQSMLHVPFYVCGDPNMLQDRHIL